MEITGKRDRQPGNLLADAYGVQFRHVTRRE